MNYYNEFDPFAAEWLRELIKDGLIPEGVVDERSITDVDPADVREFTQCHFFAGIGGWSLALELAGWPADRPVWTGSPPCQPFSVAGNKKGKSDERHLWPIFFNLINQCKPATIFGEQVASAVRHEWFDDLQADLEREGYAAGMVVLPACSVNAPQKRDRLFYAATLANSSSHRRNESLQPLPGEISERSGCDSFNNRSVGDTDNQGSQEYRQPGELHIWEQNGPSESRFHIDTSIFECAETVWCRDGRIRPVPTEPALFPLVDGIPNRVGILRGAGNAIVPQVGAEVIRAFMEASA